MEGVLPLRLSQSNWSESPLASFQPHLLYSKSHFAARERNNILLLQNNNAQVASTVHNLLTCRVYTACSKLLEESKYYFVETPYKELMVGTSLDQAVINNLSQV